MIGPNPSAREQNGMERAVSTYEPLAPGQSKYYCLLDEQPEYLVPERFLSPAGGSQETGRWVVNPAAWISTDARLPPDLDLDDALLGGLAMPPEMIWVHDTVTRIWSPYCIGPRYRSVLSRMQPGKSAPSNLDPEIVSVLALAGILVEPGADERRQAKRRQAVANAAQGYKRGYAPKGDTIHPFHIAALRRHYRRLVRSGAFRLGDSQSPLRFIAHNEQVTRFFHHQLRHLAGDIAGEPVKPTYVYAASYQSGAELPPHVDREQCEFSITLLIDQTPEPTGESPWPIHLDLPGQRITVFQGIGDALFYRGRQLPHYRKPLPEGMTSTSIFFHYVRQDFDGSLD